MEFEIVGDITDIETIAVTGNIRELDRLRTELGRGRWRKLKGRATVQTPNGALRPAELHWYEANGIGRHRLKIITLSRLAAPLPAMSHPNTATQFALCIRRAPDADLELRKAYPVLPAAPNETGYLRIIDESGEDYLYPADHFILLDLPAAAQDALRHAA